MALGHSAARVDGAGRQPEVESRGTAQKAIRLMLPQNSHGAQA